MKATLPKKSTSNAKRPSGNKETIGYRAVIVAGKGELKTPVTIKSFMSRSASASVVYSCIWASGETIHYSGHGQAGGYGYHKESAAIHYAIENAGITLSEPINGYGDAAIDTALTAITRALEYRGKMTIVGF